MPDVGRCARMVARPSDSLQLRVFRFGFLQDGDVGVGIFPQRKKIFVGGERPNTSGIGNWQGLTKSRRLRNVEALLSIVIDQFAANERSVRVMLDSAKASVIRAKARINSLSAARRVTKPQMMAKQSKRRHLTSEGRRRISLAAKKRWAAAKRTSARTGHAPVKSARERDTPRSGSLTPPRTTSQEPNQERHESQAN
jgi:hypothetical protein